MNATTKTWATILALSLLLMGCQAADSKEGGTSNSGGNSVVSQSIEDGQQDNEQQENEHSHSHNSHDDEHSHSHDNEHSHDHDEESEQIYKGYFEDSQVRDRALSDWEGEWQSVYPYLLDGTLDEVFAHKAEHNGKKTAEEYKQYYEAGYNTDTEKITIKGDMVTFYSNGQEVSGKYESDGYEILTYEAGNRGVRYIFKAVEAVEGLPQYIQFSDHRIAPSISDHYHLYWGDDREALLEEVSHWPTYYPSHMDGDAIVHEMIAH